MLQTLGCHTCQLQTALWATFIDLIVHDVAMRFPNGKPALHRGCVRRFDWLIDELAVSTDSCGKLSFPCHSKLGSGE